MKDELNFERLRKLAKELAQMGDPHEQEARSRKERRVAARMKLLPADRRCPRCNAKVLHSRGWVIKKVENVQIKLCRACYYRTVVCPDVDGSK